MKASKSRHKSSGAKASALLGGLVGGSDRKLDKLPSDSEHKPKSGKECEELDKIQVRERYDRCVFAMVDITGHAKGTAVHKEGIGQGGIILTSKHNPVTAPSQGAGWAYKNPVRPCFVDGCPPNTALIIHPGEQRFFVRSKNPDNSVDIFLDLSASEMRNRMLLHDVMEYVIFDTKTGKSTAITVEVPLGGNSDVSSSWNKKLNSPDDLWKLRAQPVLINQMSKSSTTFTSTQASSNVISRGTTDNTASTRKTVTWGYKVDLMEETKVSLSKSDDDDIITVASSDETMLSQELLDRKDAVLRVDGEEVYRSSEKGGRRCILLARSKPADMPKDFDFVPLTHEDDEFFIVFTFELDSGQLLIPQYHKKLYPRYELLLRLTSREVFPLIHGDHLTVRAPATKKPIFNVVFKIPKLSRSVPNAEAITDPHLAPESGQDLNPAHFIRDVALETSHQPTMTSSGNRLGGSNEPPRAHSFSKRYFSMNNSVRIGRLKSETEVTVLDPHLSRHHATFARVGKSYVMGPSDNYKSIFMLCGKSDSHSRPPIALRRGDTFSCGKSEFKVVFQQRGNREIHTGHSAFDELCARLKSASQELRVRTQHAETHRDRENTIERSPVSPDPDDAEQDNFKNLNPLAREDGALIPNVQFGDMKSLWEHFEDNDFGSGPLMILLTVRGPGAKKFFLCDPLETTIGSSPHARISIPIDKRMSPYHSRVYFDPAMQRWMLDDLQSNHGTFVKVDEPTLVATGDVFVMGMTLVRIFGDQMTTHQLQQQMASGRCINS